MKTPTLEPRRYKIDQNAVEYHYFVVWLLGGDKPWAIELAPAARSTFYVTKDFDIEIQCDRTAYFDTPDEALAHWVKYVKSRWNIEITG